MLFLRLHELRMRRNATGATKSPKGLRVRVTFEPEKKGAGMRVAEKAATYRAKCTSSKGLGLQQGMPGVKTWPCSVAGNSKLQDVTIRECLT